MARATTEAVRYDVSLLTSDDLYLFNEGTHGHLQDKLGAHPLEDGTVFAVWAPDAEAVSVVGEFNGWDRDAMPLRPRERSGIWEGFVQGVGHGALYKFHIRGRGAGFQADKTRVATLLLCRDISGLFYPFLDVRSAHHSASHDDKSAAYERVTRYYVSQLAYLASRECAVTAETWSVMAGRVARVFVGVTPGYFNSELTPESVAAHLEQIRTESGYAVPSSVLDEIQTVMSQFKEHGQP